MILLFTEIKKMARKYLRKKIEGLFCRHVKFEISTMYPRRENKSRVQGKYLKIQTLPV